MNNTCEKRGFKVLNIVKCLRNSSLIVFFYLF